MPFKMYRLFKPFFATTFSYANSYRFCSVVSAGVLIIGNEILKGTVDLNSPFLIKELNDINLEVLKVAIVPDDIDAIAKEVSELKPRCKYLFTSGGIGPTHDDVTYTAIAKVCNDSVELNGELFQFLVSYFGPGSEKNPGILKYATIPKSASLQFVDLPFDNRIIKYPIVSLQNIYIFPGIPSLLKNCFNALKPSFIQVPEKFTQEMFIDMDEFSVVQVLNEAVKSFKEVTFGSYPTFTNNYYKIKLVLESKSLDQIQKARAYLASKLPDSNVVMAKTDILTHASGDVYALKTSFPPLDESLSVIEQALKKYTLSELCVCFNGGKDCTAMLHLIYTCVQKFKPKDWNKLHCLYVKDEDGFEEIDNFIKDTVERYSLNMTVLEGDLKESVAIFLESHSRVKAMFIGTRKGDPGSHILKPFSQTDSDWPSIVRILPIISWSYFDVWFFIRTLQLPYCVLYDRGYTSLGSKSKTVKNPSLLRNDKYGFRSYKPAYTLEESESERKSRR